MPFKKISLLRYSSFPCSRISVKGIGENPKHGIPCDLKYLTSVTPGQMIGTNFIFLK